MVESGPRLVTRRWYPRLAPEAHRVVHAGGRAPQDTLAGALVPQSTPCGQALVPVCGPSLPLFHRRPLPPHLKSLQLRLFVEHVLQARRARPNYPASRRHRAGVSACLTCIVRPEAARAALKGANQSSRAPWWDAVLPDCSRRPVGNAPLGIRFILWTCLVTRSFGASPSLRFLALGRI